MLSKSDGRIKLAYRKGYRATEDGRIISHMGNDLSLATGNSGYKVFRIRDKHNSGVIFVHRFVAYCKYGEELFKVDCVRHKDSNRDNNSFDNILIGSFSDNYSDNNKNWKLKFARKGAQTRRKLSDDQVREIKKVLINETETVTALSRKYNVARSTIQQIKEGKSYKWLKV